MTMKHFKLFMLLALLVMGVSNAWAGSEYYKVVYSLPEGLESAGYSLRTTELQSGTLTNNNPATGYIRARRQGGNPTRLNNDNVNDYIAPYVYMGYTSSVTVSTGTTYDWDVYESVYTITITYTAVTDLLRWNDGVLEYCNYYEQSTGNIVKLNDGEVAVRLYLGDYDEFTDVMSYNSAQNKNNNSLGTYYEGYETTTTDDDGDGRGSQATYEYLGQLDAGVASMGEHSANSYFFNRTHQANYSDVTEVTIPATVTYDGVVYNVTAIQKWGFCYNVSHQTLMELCSGGNTYTLHNNINDHSNGYLQKVTFAEGCNIKSIGDYAFMSCYKLQEIQIPWTVEYLGQGAFECCNSLTDVEMQECPDQSSEYYGKTKVSVIRDFTFWSCQQLKNVYLADGITRIEGKSYGSPFQYLPVLEYLRLPNTLEHIGPHFLCSCTAIEKLTIPASVTYIDGACFHGCSSLAEVYVLGEPADLKASDDEVQNPSNTFDANAALCGQHVNNATFYVAKNELDNYKSHDVWGELAEPNDYNNKLLPIPEIPTTFTAGKWSTVIFPKRISNTTNYIATTQAQINDLFGEGAKIARLSEVRLNGGTFHLKFTQISEIPCGVPLMIKPAVSTDEDGNTINEYTYEMYGADDEADRNFRIDMTDDHDLSIKCSNSEDVVTMKGQYMKVDPLKKYDFIFKSEKKADNTYNYTFRKFVNGNAYVNPFRCWWRVTLNGYSMTSPSSQQSKFATFDDFDTTGINSAVAEPKIVIDGVYDLQGRRIDVDEKQLPSGMYIVNGKKVIKK